MLPIGVFRIETWTAVPERAFPSTDDIVLAAERTLPQNVGRARLQLGDDVSQADLTTQAARLSAAAHVAVLQAPKERLPRSQSPV